MMLLYLALAFLLGILLAGLLPPMAVFAAGFGLGVLLWLFHKIVPRVLVPLVPFCLVLLGLGAARYQAALP